MNWSSHDPQQFCGYDVEPKEHSIFVLLLDAQAGNQIAHDGLVINRSTDQSFHLHVIREDGENQVWLRVAQS